MYVGITNNMLTCINKRVTTRNHTCYHMRYHELFPFMYVSIRNRTRYHTLPLNFIKIYIIRDLLDAKSGVSFALMMSDENWFFSAGNFTVSPSNKRSKLFQGIISPLHRKSCKRITSAESAPTPCIFVISRL